MNLRLCPRGGYVDIGLGGASARNSSGALATNLPAPGTALLKATNSHATRLTRSLISDNPRRQPPSGTTPLTLLGWICDRDRRVRLRGSGSIFRRRRNRGPSCLCCPRLQALGDHPAKLGAGLRDGEAANRDVDLGGRQECLCVGQLDARPELVLEARFCLIVVGSSSRELLL